MKAVLLAAGLGTRLRPLTEVTPKCLVRVGRATLLDHWLDALAAAGIEDVLVNTHHLADQVEAHIARRDGAPPRVRTAHEATLLGSAGTLRANRDFLGDEESFLALNADNLTDFDLRRLLAAHDANGAAATITVFPAARPSECGIVEVRDGLVVGFEEKPRRPRSNLANAGMYAFRAEVLGLVDDTVPRDIGYHLLPQLVGRARAVGIGEAYLADIGTPEALERARIEWQGNLTR